MGEGETPRPFLCLTIYAKNIKMFVGSLSLLIGKQTGVFLVLLQTKPSFL